MMARRLLRTRWEVLAEFWSLARGLLPIPTQAGSAGMNLVEETDPTAYPVPPLAATRRAPYPGATHAALSSMPNGPGRFPPWTAFDHNRGVRATTRLRREFYTRPTLEVARDLLGRVLCRKPAGGPTLRGSIVEVEAYDGPKDRASHAFRGPTPRNGAMFERGGIAYVYQIYGVHFCFNIVTGRAGYPAAVLVRATEPPADGLVATGPGRLARAYDIDRRLDGTSLLGRQLWLEAGSREPDGRVRRTRRIGVDYAGEWAARDYRFIIVDHDHVSGARSRR